MRKFFTLALLAATGLSPLTITGAEAATAVDRLAGAETRPAKTPNINPIFSSGAVALQRENRRSGDRMRNTNRGNREVQRVNRGARNDNRVEARREVPQERRDVNRTQRNVQQRNDVRNARPDVQRGDVGRDAVRQDQRNVRRAQNNVQREGRETRRDNRSYSREDLNRQTFREAERRNQQANRENRRYDRSDRDTRRWNRTWRNDRRYDWHNYRQVNRNVFRIGRYNPPYRDYRYRRISIGFSIGSLFYSNRYWIADPWQYRLPPVYGGYRWVRYYDDALLVDTYTGEVVDVIYDFFW